jgi:hypothetical protein
MFCAIKADAYKFLPEGDRHPAEAASPTFDATNSIAFSGAQSAGALAHSPARTFYLHTRRVTETSEISQPLFYDIFLRMHGASLDDETLFLRA